MTTNDISLLRDSFREQFPELASTSDALVNRALREALEIHSSRTMATLYCAAHLLQLDQDINAGTASASEKSGAGVGSLSVQYVTQAEKGREAFFTSTDYGKRFLTHERRNARTGIGAMVV